VKGILWIAKSFVASPFVPTLQFADRFALSKADLGAPSMVCPCLAGRVGKSPAFVASRLKLTDLVPVAVEAFYTNAIGVGHALLLANTA
jgi:hypothetical protein